MKTSYQTRNGVLTFEWILLLTLLVIGIIGGVSAVRDAIIDELGDVSNATISLDQSYTVGNPWEVTVADCIADGAIGSRFVDSATMGRQRPGNNSPPSSQTITECDW